MTIWGVLMKLVQFTAKKLQRLKTALQQAQATGKGRHATFEFDGTEYVVGYADFLVEYLTTKLEAL